MIQKIKKNTFLVVTCLILVLVSTPALVLAADDPDCNKDNPTSSSLNKCLKSNPIVSDLNTIIAFLSGLVGVVIVGVIILGGIQYATAGDKAEAVSAAKQRIINGLIALIAYLFIFAFLQWLIPGGIF